MSQRHSATKYAVKTIFTAESTAFRADYVILETKKVVRGLFRQMK